jgi:hypothetical protein
MMTTMVFISSHTLHLTKHDRSVNGQPIAGEASAAGEGNFKARS